MRKNILLGVTGGIACFKAADLVSRLVKLGFNVDVIMTENAQKFITPLTFQVLSQNRVVIDMFEKTERRDVEHISLAQKADLAMIVPATANIIGKIANGICDDMLSTVIMATRADVLIAPAMNTAMWENSFLQENISKLKLHGYHFIDPASGRLACGDTGEGKLADIEDIVDAVKNILKKRE
ncbi:MAG: bifunctional phosphopantothenoylcysteine decarboxylase/phosphopantothenate--cysteine ligase CoaBC [Eubacteriaceae bacterium]|nr:bifunctional phosphopantothenoylcysteine decarboxylase/phosphopantothenate--cysteine ligase CoaBC [Eubacteriaceae bacterium]